MLRLAISLSCIVFAAVTLSSGASAAGRSIGPAAVKSGPPGIGHRLPGIRPWRGAGRGIHGRHHRQIGWVEPDYGWPWYDFGGSNGGVTIIERQAEAVQPVDPDAFENLMPRTGILRGPAPEPTIYRIEGPRSRPATRIIRIAGSDAARGGTRSRFAHVETGALLLTVPRR